MNERTKTKKGWEYASFVAKSIAVKTFFLSVLFCAVCIDGRAAAKAGEATVNVNATTTISLASTYQTTLKRSTISTYRWSTTSSNVNITSQSAYSCTVKGVSAGTAQVDYYCSYWIDGYYRTMDFYYTVTIKSGTTGPASITISPSSISLWEGETYSISATQTGAIGGAYFTTSNSSVATVSAGSYSGYKTPGTVTAVNAGTAYIYAKCMNGITSDEPCVVTVKAKPVDIYLPASKTIEIGEYAYLSATVSPSNATYSLSWSSSDTDVATVSSTGRVYGKSAGTARITAKINNFSLSDVCVVTVKAPQQEQHLSLSQLPQMTYGDVAYQLPETTTEGLALSWSSNNSSVATISDGKLLVNAAGEATVTATQSGNSSYFAFSRTYSLTVAKAQLTITVNDCSRYIGEENSNFAVNYAGFVNGDDETSLTVLPNITTTATSESPAGDYPVVASGAMADNYDIIYVDGTLTIVESPNSQDVVVTDISTMDNAIYMESLTSNSGTVANADIKLKNSSSIAAYSFDLSLPEGVTLKKNENGKFVSILSGDRHDEHVISINESGDNCYSVAVLSLSGGELTGSDGTVVTLSIAIAGDMEEGIYPINIQNVRYSYPDGQTIDVGNTKSALTIENVIIGDVNGNRVIDIGDAVCIVNYIVGKKNAVFVEKAADVNGNGVIGEIGDAVSVINAIVGK